MPPMNVADVENSKIQLKIIPKEAKDKKFVFEDQVEISRESLIAAEVQRQTIYNDSQSNIKMTEKQRTELVEQLKQELETNNAKFIDYVKTTFLKQGRILSDGDSLWQFIAKGDYVVDAATKEKAKEAISEQGYYSVEQVSTRIYEFALALTGGDAEKMKRMEESFEQGFKAAIKSWGKDLPEISNQTFAAVKDKFNDFYKQQTLN